jgi:hypothetical protein
MTKYLPRVGVLFSITAALLLLAGAGCGGGTSTVSQPSTPPTGSPTPISLPSLTLTATGTVGTPYNFVSPAITGGTAPYTVSVSTGALPTGLSIAIGAGNTATLTGTPTAVGTFNFTVLLKDSSTPQQSAASSQFTIIITAPSITLPAVAPPDAAVNQVYSFSSSAIIGGVPPFSASIVSGALPSGLALSLGTGNVLTVSGTPTALGTFSFTVQVKDSFTPQQIATSTLITMKVVNLKINTAFLPNAINAQPGYVATLSSFGGTAPLTWSVITGSLPVGLVLNASTGVISGTPTTTGPASFTLKLADSTGASISANLSINVLPERPRVTLDTTMPAPGAGSPIQLAGGNGLQVALDSAPCGSTIKLHAGDTWTGNFTFPRKSPECTSATPIIIISDDPTLPPPGTRVTPADAAKMPKIVTSVTNVAALDFSSQNSAPGGSFYRIVGVEVSLTGAALTTNFDSALISLGNNEASVSLMPHDIIIDRCYVHGTITSGLRRAVLMNGVNLAVIDSNISEIHQVGFDTQAIAGWNGPGPLKIQNNRLEAAGENILFGGAVGANNNGDTVPSDIEIRNNYLFKPLAWQVVSPLWSVKNILELKNAQRVLIEGNVLENNWTAAQVGFAVLFTPRASLNQGGPSATVSEITVKDNLILHVGSGVNIAGIDNNESGFPIRGKNIALLNNVILDANDQPLSQNPFGAAGSGRLFQLQDGVPNVTIEHNTGFPAQAIVFADLTNSPTRPNTIMMRHNLFSRAQFGVFCSGIGEGTPALTLCAVPPSPSFFSFNVLIGGPASFYPSSNATCSLSGAGCYPADSAAAGILDPSNCSTGSFDFTRCALNPSSSYRAAGQDGKDLGADITLVAKPLAPTTNPVKP